MKRDDGFTLIEIAIALFIVALVLGAVVSLATAQMANQRQAATSSSQQTIKTALINFIARNNRLPCPANPTIVAGAAGDGMEFPTPGQCTGAPTSGAGAQTVVSGAVPWMALGLPQAGSTDGFLNRLTYQVTLDATKNRNAHTVAGMRGAITVHTAGPGTLGNSDADPAGNQANDCTPYPPPPSVAYDPNKNPCAAVVVIVSHGSSGDGAYSSQGAQLPMPSGADEAENADGDSMFVFKQYADSETNNYDDIVLALTTNDLLSPLTLAGSVRDYRAVLNENFNTIKGAIVGYASQYRSGSSPTYTWTVPPARSLMNPPDPYPDCGGAGCLDGVFSGLPTTPIDPAADPWGNHVLYSPGAGIACVSWGAVAYTLASKGPDGISGTQDDISLTVTGAELIPLLGGC